jgi:ribonuclease R
MLPELLSNHVCSLRPGVPRLTQSAFMRFDAEGAMAGSRLAETWIVSRVKLSYQAAEALFERREPPAGHWAVSAREASGETPHPELPDWDVLRPQLAGVLADMRHLAALLRRRRMQAGALEIETSELRVQRDQDGRIVGIATREDLESYRVIEEFMLAANRTVAERLAAAQQPLLWRSHDTPDERAAEELRQFLKKLGIEWSFGDPPSNQDFQRVIRAVARRPEHKYLMFRVLRSLKKAQYEARRRPHFGLAFEQYTHFTSPIRRYPDLYNHRLVRQLLRGSRATDDPGRRGAALSELGAHTSEREVAAAEAERASLKLAVCEALVDQVGATAVGCISAITDHGLYVDVPAWHAEGLVHVSSFRADDWVPDVQRTQLRSTRSRRTLRFGQEVRVELLHVDPDRRQIDLALVHER